MGRLKSFAWYTMSNAPWALGTSLAPGLSNYITILIIAWLVDLEAAGRFRIFLSIVGLLSLFSLEDTSKIVIRYVLKGHEEVFRPLLLHRMRWSLIGVVLGLGVSAYLFAKDNPLAPAILVASFWIPIRAPTEMYEQINQARGWFRLNCFLTSFKYTLIALTALFMLSVGFSEIDFFIAGLSLHCIVNMIYLSRYRDLFVRSDDYPKEIFRESNHLSVSGAPNLLLEHADKFLVAYLFDLDTLAVYTIAISTGRLLLNLVKPTLTIYFSRLSRLEPTAMQMSVAFVAMTAVGVAVAVLSKYYFMEVLPGFYETAYPISFVIFAGMGIYSVGVLAQYSSIFFRDGRIEVPVYSNLARFGITGAYMAILAIRPGEWTLLLLAASYPLREAVTLFTNRYFRMRLAKKAQQAPELQTAEQGERVS
ncbi:lipopolysaccharide biosynthesis protein [Afifella pfennigii]|uniref:lipopolysaccharide biosynthesis protein n=1 Tax=Afifella pfennigii TaxID=209897 RepID=UPI00047A2DA9|nr:oligosaccharide flippase family protein [Afifella pfennigii]